MRRVHIVLAVLLLTLVFARSVPVFAQGTSLAEQLRGLLQHAQEGIAAADQNKPDAMRAEYAEIDALWETFEDQIREQDPAGYVELEGALSAIKSALQAQSLDPVAVRATYAQLEHEANEVASRLGSTTSSPPIVATEATVADIVKNLDAAYAALERSDGSSASTQLDAVINAWPSIEGAIKVKSPEAYTTIEAELGRATTALRAQPPNLERAEVAVVRLRETLAPFATAQAYTALDAAAIMLREGLEALLVIVALLAFLRRSGNSNKRGWIWVGGGLGVLASIVIAIAAQAVFSRVATGQNREVIEGVTGLVAAVLLFYVSYWLHSKTSLYAWQGYINAHTTQALARGSMLGLALLAFLAVFREGVETTIFYLGMASSIALRDLLLGIGLGAVVLVIAAVLMLVVGVKLPLRPFFRIAGLLVYYLGFKFVGTGIHELQVAGLVPSSPIPGLSANPVFGFFGIFPTWETTLPQLALLLGALIAFFYLRALERRARAAAIVAAA